MDKIIRTGCIAALAFMTFICHAQENAAISHEGRNALTFSGLRFASVISFGYSYQLWQNDKQTFRTGLQTGIGYGHYIDNFNGWSIPLGVFGEYGKKHRVGFDANFIYQYSTTLIPGFVPTSTDVQNLRVVFDNGVFNSTVYYSYNFGNNTRYFLGAGYGLKKYFGSNYGYEIDNPIEYTPFIFFGVRF